MDSHACRPDLRLALAAAGTRGSLCVERLEGNVCERLRGGVEQGDERRSLRPGLRSAKQKLALYLGGALAPPTFQPIVVKSFTQADPTGGPPLQVLALDLKFPFLNQPFASFRIALQGSGPPDPRSKAES